MEPYHPILPHTSVSSSDEDLEGAFASVYVMSNPLPHHFLTNVQLPNMIREIHSFQPLFFRSNLTHCPQFVFACSQSPPPCVAVCPAPEHQRPAPTNAARGSRGGGDSRLHGCFLYGFRVSNYFIRVYGVGFRLMCVSASCGDEQG